MLPNDLAVALHLAAVCDRAGIDVVWVRGEAAVAPVTAAVRRALVYALPDVDEPWARTIHYSPGRTSAEAIARAHLDPAFDREDAVIGTLEHCQAHVRELVAAGVGDLRCVLPDVSDVHDAVAQLSAIAVGVRRT